MAAPRSPALAFGGCCPAPPQRARPIITDHRRVYSEAEFALILRRAAELEHRAGAPRPESEGLTLAEMQAAAAEVGIDPALVERAARLLPTSASPSLIERIAGGPVRHESGVHLPMRLDEAGAARLLAAVQMSAGKPGTGHSSALGMVWHAADEGEPLSVTAEPEEDGTSIAVRLDRGDTMASVQVMAGLGVFGTTMAALGLGSELGPAVGAAVAVSGIGGLVAIIRTWWTASTRRARERIGGMMDAVGRAVAEPRNVPEATRAIGHSSGTPPAEPGTPADGR